MEQLLRIRLLYLQHCDVKQSERKEERESVGEPVTTTQCKRYTFSSWALTIAPTKVGKLYRSRELNPRTLVYL